MKTYSFWGGIQEPKTATYSRAESLLLALAKLLLGHREYMGNPAPEDYLFRTCGFRPIDPTNARKRFERALVRAGLKSVILYNIRILSPRSCFPDVSLKAL